MFTLFTNDRDGPWRVSSIQAICGATLPSIERLAVVESARLPEATSPWPLAGVSSYVRYVHRDEKTELNAKQSPLGRAEATRGALIPITKSPEWWALTQDERRAIFEERSHHIAASMKYMPAIARKLYHSRELGQPFDFLTWFEFAPDHTTAFDELVAMLRATEEWRYVVREVDIRVSRAN